MKMFDPKAIQLKAPVTKPKVEVTAFNPKTALAEVAARRQAQAEETQRALLVANDPTKLEIPQTLGPVPAWSFSALKKFESCNYATYLSKVMKLRGPESESMVRGSAIHAQAEDYVQHGDGPVPIELRNIEAELVGLRDRYLRNPGQVEIEQDWGFDITWKPTGWTAPDVWCRQKLDVFYKETPTSAVVIDYKTGKKFGNELKHAEQGLHYAIGAFKRYPELDFIRTEFWYTDVKTDNKLRKNYTRDRALIHLPKIHQRALIMTTTTQFLPKPSKPNCKYCEFRESGDCEYAYEDF